VESTCSAQTLGYAKYLHQASCCALGSVITSGFGAAYAWEIHTPGLIRKPIKELIDELDPNEFWQIHRATVVRVDAVDHVSRNFRGRQIVHVKGSAEKLEVSRTFNHLFKQM
jgi:hypothetical protein